MPTPLPPAQARRPTLLIVGCGDVGLRVLHLVHPRWRVLALTSSPARVPALRAMGAVPLVGDAADFLFRSNTRNLRIVKKHLDKHHPAARTIDG